MQETKAPKEKRDLLVPAAIAMGVAGVGLGLYFFTKKPEGVDPGDTVLARFKFGYVGSGGLYTFQVWFGAEVLGGWFNHVIGPFLSEAPLDEPGPYEIDVECLIPMGTGAQKYDAESLIRIPGMGEFDYLPGTKIITTGAINVRK